MDKRAHLSSSEKYLCPVCGQSLDRFIKIAGFRIYRCIRCYAEVVRPLPSPEKLHDFYQESEYHCGDRYDVTGGTTGENYTRTKRLQTISRLTPTRGSILDVGCATGGFLLVAKQHGWQVSGIEISEYALARANRLLGKETVIREIGNLEQGASFDAISLWAFIEHIPDPESRLNELYQILEPGGILALSTPNTRSLSKRIFSARWRYYLPPEHLNYFNRKNLGLLLNRAGFEIIITRYVIVFPAYFPRGSKLLILVNRTKPARIFCKLVLLPILIFAFVFKMGDTMEIYAKKIRRNN